MQHAAERRELSQQQELQLSLLTLALTPADPSEAPVSHGGDNEDDSMDGGEAQDPVVTLAEQLWAVGQARAGADGSGSDSRFAAHLSLALVALGVVPRNSGANSSRRADCQPA